MCFLSWYWLINERWRIHLLLPLLRRSASKWHRMRKLTKKVWWNRVKRVLMAECEEVSRERCAAVITFSGMLSWWLLFPMLPSASAFWLRTYYLSQLCMLCDGSEDDCTATAILLPALETLWLWPKLPLWDCFISLAGKHHQPSTSPYGALSAGGTKSTRESDVRQLHLSQRIVDGKMKTILLSSGIFKWKHKKQRCIK